VAGDFHHIFPRVASGRAEYCDEGVVKLFVRFRVDDGAVVRPAGLEIANPGGDSGGKDGIGDGNGFVPAYPYDADAAWADAGCNRSNGFGHRNWGRIRSSLALT